MATQTELDTVRWVHEKADGKIAVVYPVDPNLTLDEIKAKVIANLPSGKTLYEVTASDIPTDRTFRNAWTYTP